VRSGETATVSGTSPGTEDPGPATSSCPPREQLPSPWRDGQVEARHRTDPSRPWSGGVHHDIAFDPRSTRVVLALGVRPTTAVYTVHTVDLDARHPITVTEETGHGRFRVDLNTGFPRLRGEALKS